MAGEKTTFFGQLRSLASHLDREVEDLKRAAMFGPGGNRDSYSQAARCLHHASEEAKTLRDGLMNQLESLQRSGCLLVKTFSLGSVVLHQQQERLARLEDYLSQHGYVRSVVKKGGLPEAQEVEAEKETDGDVAVDESETTNIAESNIENQTSSSAVRTPVVKSTNPSRYDLAALQMQTIRIENFGTLTVPSLFDSGEVLVTPGLFDRKDWTKGSEGPGLRLRQASSSPVSQPNFEEETGRSPMPPLLTTTRVRGLSASPGPRTPPPPVLETPGVRQIQRVAAPISPTSASSSSTAASSRTPSPPVLETPGIQQIQRMTDSPPLGSTSVKSVSNGNHTPSPPSFSTRVEGREVTPPTQNGQSDNLWPHTPEPPKMTFSLAEIRRLQEA